MIQVSVRGFQAVEDVSFEIEGFTALVGRSNIGKSAIVRAIKCALTNASGTDFVRHGERCSRKIRGTKKCRCQCSVWIRTPGLDLLWEKGDETNQYTVNGQVYNRVDRGTPTFLQPDFSPVKVGDEKLLLQVADQFEPIFLLNRPGTVVADVLSDVAMLDDINAATSLAEKDRREAVSTHKVRENDLVEAKRLLEAYTGLDEPVSSVAQVERAYKLLSRSVQEVRSLELLLERLQALAAVVRGLKPVDQLGVPDLDVVMGHVGTYQRLVAFDDSFRDRSVIVSSLGAVDHIEIPEAENLVRDAQLLASLEAWVATIQDFKAKVERWRAVESVAEPQYDLDQASTTLTALWRMDALYEELTTEVSALESSLAQSEAVEAEVLAEWDVLGVCPTCSQSLRAKEHVAHV